MDYSLLLDIVFWVSVVIIVLGILTAILNIEDGLKVVLGGVVTLVGIILLITHRPVIATMFDIQNVGVFTDEDTSTSQEYITVVVPKEDKELVLSKKHTIEELRSIYNSDEYEGERYIKQSEAYEVNLESTTGYQIKE